MTGIAILEHLLALAHGLAAAYVSIAIFYFVGLLVLPPRWSAVRRWPDNVILGLTLFVLLCWMAARSRLPVIYVTLAFGVLLWALLAARFRFVQATLGSLRQNADLRQWLAGFGAVYLIVYLLVRPPAGSHVLTLAPDGSLDLVTYARYAKELLAYGTAGIDMGAFEYLRSPASSYLLAWQSLFYLGDPLSAAVPLMFMIAALFGSIAADIARSVFQLSWRGALAVAALAVCAPVSRWVLVTYSLGELLSATCMLYLAAAAANVAARRSIRGSLALGVAAGGTLLLFSASWQALSAASIVRGTLEIARQFSIPAVVGFPSAVPATVGARDAVAAAALLLLPLVPLAWAGAAWLLRRSPALDRIGAEPDRRLARALVIYVALAVIVGNAAVQIVRGPAPLYWPGTWRELAHIGRMPFRTLTLKVSDEPDSLSTALAMYYMPGRKTRVIGRKVPNDELPFEDISWQQPMFIQGLSCDAAGHGDIAAAPGVGCLLMAPPSMTVGTSYPFNRPFLFLDFDRMTSREPGGRWNTDPTLNLRLTADPQRASLDRTMYVNFLVNAFLPAGEKPLRLVARWGRDRRGDIAVGNRTWFSLPVGSNDWSGNRLWTVPVAIDFPDGRTILFHEVALTESPRGEVAGRESSR